MINIGVEMSGRYKLEAVRGDGSVRLLADWFENLITNTGLDKFGSEEALWDANITKNCYVGTGSTAPAVTDTQLATWLATQNAPSPESSISVPSRYYSCLFEYNFAVGAATGNISEVGVGDTQTSLFSRALILDGSQLPTTITVLASESLRVTYELRVNVPTGDFVSVADGYTFTIKAANADTADANNWLYRTAYINWGNITTGALGATIDDNISGVSNLMTGSANGAYVGGSYTKTATMDWNTGVANGSLSALDFRFGPGRWQAGISPAIVKDNTKTLKITVRLTWAREGELP